MEEERGREKETKILILKLYSFRENDDEVGVGEIDDRVREIVFDICFLHSQCIAQLMYVHSQHDDFVQLINTHCNTSNELKTSSLFTLCICILIT